MTSAPTSIAAARRPMRQRTSAAPPTWTLWGATALDVHDRLWASRGVQVIRPGKHQSVDTGPSLYLLLGRTRCLDFRLAPVLPVLHWQQYRALRLRIVDQTISPYRERVQFGIDGRFRAIRRDYANRLATTAQCWITPDASIAEVWAGSEHRWHGAELVRSIMPRDSFAAMRLTGRVFDLRLPAQAWDWMQQVSSHAERVTAVFDGVYQYQPGVWAHETSRIDPTAELVGNLWIGAHVRVEAGQCIVGPMILPDQHPPDDRPIAGDAPGPAGASASSNTAAASIAQRPVRWDLVFDPHWSKLPTLRNRSVYRVTKRLFDIVFSIVMLALTLPLYPLIMLAIFLEDGRPFFFVHQRQTLAGRPFGCVKFRTMRRDAEHLKAQLVAQNVCDGPQFYMKNDPRILRVGTIMRKMQIDELPQFWNILLGQMSVVGPRPSPDNENQFCPAWREARLSVRPGLTGLWQVRRTREPETDFQEWIRYDLEYVQRQSWPLDIWIIIQTIRTIL